MSSNDRKALPKMGDKSRAFVSIALEVAAQNPEFLPRSFDLEEMRKDVQLFEALYPVLLSLTQLQELVDDTTLAVGSEDRLVSRLFDSPEFTQWLKGTHQLHIFLDSLDEYLLRIDTLATLLVDEFKRYQNDIDRLHLRIACRTAVWQPVLEEGLKQIWGKDSVGIYELFPKLVSSSTGAFL